VYDSLVELAGIPMEFLSYFEPVERRLYESNKILLDKLKLQFPV